MPPAIDRAAYRFIVSIERFRIVPHQVPVFVFQPEFPRVVVAHTPGQGPNTGTQVIQEFDAANSKAVPTTAVRSAGAAITGNVRHFLESKHLVDIAVEVAQERFGYAFAFLRIDLRCEIYEGLMRRIVPVRILDLEELNQLAMLFGFLVPEVNVYVYFGHDGSLTRKGGRRCY